MRITHYRTFIFAIILGLSSCHFTSKNAISDSTNKICGVSLEGSRSPVGSECFIDIQSINSNYVSLMPYAYVDEGQSELIFENLDWQWWGERKEGTRACIRLAHEQGIGVMLKPHVWIKHGEFTGEMDMASEQDWLQWEDDYKNYIMQYVEIAESLDVELFCLGTELETFVLKRTAFWDELIAEIKTKYKGKLTYAANWNEYTKVPFWDEMDFIGIDAYFPVSEIKNPTVNSLIHNWEKWKSEIKSIHDQYNKPVLFTEYGYQSIEGSTVTPWHVDRIGEVSNQEQKDAYEALYNACWNEDWMAGGFLWKWHVKDHQPEKKIKRFTPQHKPALEIVKQYYGKE
ncbi:MAG: hypothetical protein ACI8XB_000406 [Patiriisocius sp.]|jgi:hypothetical protein